MPTHYRTCTLCEALCGVAIEHDGARVQAVRGDRDDPFSRGHICPKALALADVHEDPDRLRHPLRRGAGGWEPVAWDEALDDIARRLAAIRAAHGADAVAFYEGNPTSHNVGLLLFAPMLLRVLGTRNHFTAGSVDQLPRLLACYLLFGHQYLIPVPDLDRTEHLVILGANPAVSNGSLMSAPDVARRLRAIVARGGRVVLLDPRRNDTAALASEHHFVRPGTDALLLLALLATVFDEGLARPGRLEPWIDGVELLAGLARRFPPESVAGAVGLDAKVIRRLARDFARADRAVCYGRMGVSTQPFGALATWLIDALNIVTGNLDREGGAMFNRPAFDSVRVASLYGLQGSFGRYRSRVRGLPEFSGELPLAALAEEIETPGRGQVRALVVSAGNPVLSGPNGRRLERALAGLELLVSVDPYVNETSRFAHYVLPPTSALERGHYDVGYNLLAIRHVARYSPALFAPPAGALHDWEIMLELATRVAAHRGLAPGLVARAARAWLRRWGPEGIVDMNLRFGPYGGQLGPHARGLDLDTLRAAPHGLDLGALEPCLPERLPAGGRIRLVPAPYLAEVERLAGFHRALTSAGPGLVLVGRRDLRSSNSWLHNSARLARGPERCTLLLHPDDARARGLVTGQQVRVRSRVGEVRVPLEVSDAMMPGVASLPHGWGHGREGVALRVAQQRPGASANDLTDDARVDALCGTAGFSGLPIEVSADVPEP